MKWTLTKSPPPLKPCEAHIWLVDLDQLTNQEVFLNDAEKNKIKKMTVALHRQRFINARGTLRKLLAHYLHCDPKIITLMTTSRGKLYLKNDPDKIFFNLTHSKNLAIYAFNYQYEIGVDIEVKRILENLFDIAERIFSPIELDYLYNKNSSPSQKEKFFILWTRKEALVKATGDGLSAPVRNITTTLADGTLNSDIEYATHLNLALFELPAIKNFSATLAANKNLMNHYYFALAKN